MPSAAPRWCPRCASPHPSGAECPAGAEERRAEVDRHRPSARQRLYTTEWDKRRAQYIHKNPRCVVCGAPAQEVDHILDHHGDHALFWAETNWQSLCKPCHSAKTMTTLNQRK